MIARDITFQDCSVHFFDAEDRRKGISPIEKVIRSITTGNNVWIGTEANILLGTKISDDSIIFAFTTVGRSIPPNHLVH